IIRPLSSPYAAESLRASNDSATAIKKMISASLRCCIVDILQRLDVMIPHAPVSRGFICRRFGLLSIDWLYNEYTPPTTRLSFPCYAPMRLGSAAARRRPRENLARELRRVMSRFGCTIDLPSLVSLRDGR